MSFVYDAFIRVIVMRYMLYSELNRIKGYIAEKLCENIKRYAKSSLSNHLNVNARHDHRKIIGIAARIDNSE